MKRTEIHKILTSLGYGLDMRNAIMAKRRGVSWDNLCVLEEKYGITALHFRKIIDALPKHTRSK